jgi:hypothetical protein
MEIVFQEHVRAMRDCLDQSQSEWREVTLIAIEVVR